MSNVSAVSLGALRVAAYTGGRDVPSARFRVRQYLNAMPRLGIELNEIASRAGQYPPHAIWRRPAWLLTALAERGLQAKESNGYDAVIFQREFISTLLTLERWFGRPRVLDVDDAIWQHRRGGFAGKLAACCDAVICGNAYLADYFSQHCQRIFVLPTAVDADRFYPLRTQGAPSQVIGWSGTGSNLAELERIQPALRTVMNRFPRARLRVVCNRCPGLGDLPADRVDFVRWTPEVEVSALQDMQVGLMPLQETPWTRGKCAFKMLTYMACAVPVVASPVGMNGDVLAMGSIGFGARNNDEWVDALTELLTDSGAGYAMGDAGRAVIDGHFSVQVLSVRLAEIIRAVADG